MTQKHHSDEHIWVVFLRHLMKERSAQSKNVTMDKVGGPTDTLPVLHRRPMFLLCYIYYRINRINVQQDF